VKFFLLLFVVLILPKAYGQENSNPHRFGDSRAIAGLCFGADFFNNRCLNDWLVSNGVSVPNRLGWSGSVYTLSGVGKRALLGFDVREGITSNSNTRIFYGSGSLLFGVPFDWKKMSVIPVIGVGGSYTSILFSNTIPPPLARLNLGKDFINENEFYINPHLFIQRRFHGPLLIGFEVGCKIYVYPHAWRYGGVSISEIPNSSFSHPYFTIVLGGGDSGPRY